MSKIPFSTPVIGAVAGVALVDWTVVVAGLLADWWLDAVPQATFLVLLTLAVSTTCAAIVLFAVRIVVERTLAVGHVFDEAYQSGFAAGRTRGLSEAVSEARVIDLRTPAARRQG